MLTLGILTQDIWTISHVIVAPMQSIYYHHLLHHDESEWQHFKFGGHGLAPVYVTDIHPQEGMGAGLKIYNSFFTDIVFDRIYSDDARLPLIHVFLQKKYT